MTRENVTRAVLILLVVFISVVFFRMIERMFLALLMAAILAGLAHPFYRRLLGACRGHRPLAAVFTELILVLRDHRAAGRRWSAW